MLKADADMVHEFETRDAASQAAAQRMAKRLIKRVDSDQCAALVVSGGTTPAECFDYLSKLEVGWRRVFVLPSDERWVPNDDSNSNERQIRDRLMKNAAAAAEFVPFADMKTQIAQRCEVLSQTIRRLPLPFASCLLGMGTDGHFASLFGDAENLDKGLNIDGSAVCIPVATAASPFMRISLTLAAITRSDEVILLIFGDEKRRVCERAMAGDDAFPIAHLLGQRRVPVKVYWAP